MARLNPTSRPGLQEYAAGRDLHSALQIRKQGTNERLFGWCAEGVDLMQAAPTLSLPLHCACQAAGGACEASQGGT